jgi:hypothetical protein
LCLCYVQLLFIVNMILSRLFSVISVFFCFTFYIYMKQMSLFCEVASKLIYIIIICIFDLQRIVAVSYKFILMRILMFLMGVLTLADYLCCAWFICPILCWCWCPGIGTNSVIWAQLNRFHLKMATESILGNVIF